MEATLMPLRQSKGREMALVGDFRYLEVYLQHQHPNFPTNQSTVYGGTSTNGSGPAWSGVEWTEQYQTSAGAGILNTDWGWPCLPRDTAPEDWRECGERREERGEC